MILQNLLRLIIVLRLSMLHCLLSCQQDSGIFIAQESVVLRVDLLLGGKHKVSIFLSVRVLFFKTGIYSFQRYTT